jgi:hypothetical protein
LSADHLTIVYLAVDLAADTWRSRRRRRRGQHIDVSMGAVVVVVLVVLLVLAAVVVLIVVVRGHDWHPVRVLVGVAEVAGVPVWAQLPSGKCFLDWGRDGESGVTPQGLRQEGAPPAYPPHAFRPISRDRRNGHTTAV